jgi:hypothetical protein
VAITPTAATIVLTTCGVSLLICKIFFFVSTLPLWYTSV